MMPAMLGNFVDFTDADVLFIYSTMVLNNTKKLDELLKITNLVLSEESDLSVDEIVTKVILLEKQLNAKLPEEKKKTQLAAVVEYLENVAKEEGYEQQIHS